MPKIHIIYNILLVNSRYDPSIYVQIKKIKNCSINSGIIAKEKNLRNMKTLIQNQDIPKSYFHDII